MPPIKGSYKICSKLKNDVLFVCKNTDDIFGSYEYHYGLLIHNHSPYPTLLNHVQRYGIHDLQLVPYPDVEPEKEKAIIQPEAKETRRRKVEKTVELH